MSVLRRMFCFSASSASLFRISSVSDVLLNSTRTSPLRTEAPSSTTSRSTMPASSGLNCTVVMGCTCPVTRM